MGSACCTSVTKKKIPKKNIGNQAQIGICSIKNEIKPITNANTVNTNAKANNMINREDNIHSQHNHYSTQRENNIKHLNDPLVDNLPLSTTQRNLINNINTNTTHNVNNIPIANKDIPIPSLSNSYRFSNSNTNPNRQKININQNNEMIINNNNEDINCNVSINDEFPPSISSSSSLREINRDRDRDQDREIERLNDYFCNRCNCNYRTLHQYSNHIPFCLEERDENINRNINEMHNSLNQILNLVHSLHTQLNTNGMMAILSSGDCEEATEYFDWEFIKSDSSGLGLGGIWKNKGKITLIKKELKDIEQMSLDTIKSERYYIKRIWLLKYINTHIYDKSNDNTPLVISRQNVLEESFNQFMTTNELDLKRAMHIFFIDEVAQDVGGVYREWYSCLFKEIFSKRQNFFYECPNKGLGKNTYLISNTAPLYHSEEKEQLKYYEFIGKVIAKALFDKITLNINLNHILIKQLLKKPLSLSDMAYYDIDIYTSLSSILNANLFKSDLPFTWNMRNEYDELIDVELIPNGRAIYVNDSNKNLFIDKVIELITYTSVKEKLTALLKGFDSLIANDIISIFSPEEFDFILSGQTMIDLEDWKRNTVYKGYYSEKHWIIKAFWEIMGELKAEELVQFFKFCTGCNRVPIDGFISLQGTRNKLLKFSIESPLKKEMNDGNGNGNGSRLIEAKTCFNRITLPEYQSKEQMKKAIYTIINNDTNFFGLQ